MNKRLKIIGVIFGIIYIAILGFNLPSQMGEFTDGFRDGFNSVQKTGKRAGRLYDIMQFDVQPKGERYNDDLQNLASGETLKAKVSTFAVKIKPQEPSIGKELFVILSGIVAFAILFILIAIPILIVIIIRSIVRNNVFNLKNINLLKWIGYLLVALFVFILFLNIREYATAKSLIELQNYKIVFSMGDSYMYLIMGVATLLFAEILKIATKMKEENDLTI
ncbi:MAG: DUF2975 domain-containing protein [Paludibacter sp.]|nr:DUF2975 domain-containing protein [Paludibacter sp.]